MVKIFLESNLMLLLNDKDILSNLSYRWLLNYATHQQSTVFQCAR